MQALGAEDLEKTNFGGAVMDASAQAIRRCLASVGVGRYLYSEKCRPSKQNKQVSLPPINHNINRSAGEISREEWLALKDKNN